MSGIMNSHDWPNITCSVLGRFQSLINMVTRPV